MVVLIYYLTKNQLLIPLQNLLKGLLKKVNYLAMGQKLKTRSLKEDNKCALQGSGQRLIKWAKGLLSHPN